MEKIKFSYFHPVSLLVKYTKTLLLLILTSILLMVGEQLGGEVYGGGGVALVELERQLAQRGTRARRRERLALAQRRPQTRPGICAGCVATVRAGIGCLS